MRAPYRFTRIRRRWAVLSAVAALVLVLGLGGLPAAKPSLSVAVNDVHLATSATSTAAAPPIEIKKHKFSLPTVTVPAGTTVTWINRDDDAHTVVSTTALFRSPGLDTDESYSYRFTKIGTYQYFCTLHPLMTGKVIVK